MTFSRLNLNRACRINLNARVAVLALVFYAVAWLVTFLVNL